jgi:flagellar basal-body rod modification protein FlgD
MTAVSAATAANPAATAAKTGSTALDSLTGNFQTFLTMLTTQLKNQDPTSPMDSSQFTTELVQFSGVEQQINTNSNLQQLISLTQGNNVLQSSQILGKTVEATADHLPLQQGSGQIHFTAASDGPVAITLYDTQGRALYACTVAATQGENGWAWQGQTANGGTTPDGSYKIAVAAVAPDGSTSAIPFTVLGKATSVQQQGSAVQVLMGAQAVDMAKVTAVRN